MNFFRHIFSLISNMNRLKKIFDFGIGKFYFANTAYPPDKSNWRTYNGPVTFSCWNKEPGFGLYIHIPFCKGKCRFCEYTTMPLPGETMVEAYIDSVVMELSLYKEKIDFESKEIYGFDIGGGTPSLLSDRLLDKLLSNVIPITDKMGKPADYEQSFETNVEMAANNPGFLKILREYGFSRISMGVQTVDSAVLSRMDRGDQEGFSYKKAVANFRAAGFQKVNLDVMYGLPGQTLQSWEKTMDYVLSLNPDQISVYETRYKDSLLKNQQEQVAFPFLLSLYDLGFKKIQAAGFYGRYGTSAFTKNRDDTGLSSYLGKRTTQFISYIGLGAGSQGMTREHLSYNYSKLSGNIQEYMANIAKRRSIEFFYRLPVNEILGKYIGISYYLGYLNYKELNRRLGIDFLKTYEEVLQFLKTRDFILIDEDNMYLTPLGYKHYHGIIPLFYSTGVQDYFLMNK